jgi:hypothetical protein
MHSKPGNIERVARREADATYVGSVTYAFFGWHRPTRMVSSSKEWGCFR